MKPITMKEAVDLANKIMEDAERARKECLEDLREKDSDNLILELWKKQPMIYCRGS